MKAKLIERNYEKSETILVQGNYEKIKEAEKAGYHIRSGGNGSYIMSRDSEATVTFEAGGKIRKSSIKKLLLNTYGGMVRVTEKKFNTFCDEWEAGNRQVEFSEEEGLHF